MDDLGNISYMATVQELQGGVSISQHCVCIHVKHGLLLAALKANGTDDKSGVISSKLLNFTSLFMQPGAKCIWKQWFCSKQAIKLRTAQKQKKKK